MSTITGEVFIKNLVIKTRVGVTAEERAYPQDLVVNITLSVDAHAAISSDDIHDTVDYAPLYVKIMDFAKDAEHKLIESLANSLADICLHNSKSTKVHICIEKPHILIGAESAGFSLTKEK